MLLPEKLAVSGAARAPSWMGARRAFPVVWEHMNSLGSFFSLGTSLIPLAPGPPWDGWPGKHAILPVFERRSRVGPVPRRFRRRSRRTEPRRRRDRSLPSCWRRTAGRFARSKRDRRGFARRVRCRAPRRQAFPRRRCRAPRPTAPCAIAPVSAIACSPLTSFAARIQQAARSPLAGKNFGWRLMRHAEVLRPALRARPGDTPAAAARASRAAGRRTRGRLRRSSPASRATVASC